MPGRSRSRFRTWFRVPLTVVAATLAFGALAGVWSVVAPLGEAPDEPAHLGLVLYLADGHGYPRYDQLHSPAATFRLCSTFAAATRACPRPGEPVTKTSVRAHPAAQAPDKRIRPAWDDAGGDELVGRVNQMPQHPPLYYEGMALVLRVERALQGEPWSLDRELALLRLVNAILVMPLPVLAWWAARRIGADDVTARTASLVPFALPMLTHIGSTLNNDNLLILCGAGVIALLAGVLQGDRTRRTALAVGVVTGIALLTKASAAMFVPAIIGAYLIGLRARRAEGDVPPRSIGRFVRPALVPAAIAGGVTAVLAAWWYIGVRARTGQFAPTTEDDRLSSALRSPGFHPSVWNFLTHYARDMSQRFWGSFGWYSVRFSSGFASVLSVGLLALVVVGLLVGPRRSPGRLALAGLLLPMAFLKLFVMQHAWSLYVRTSTYPFIQGRYLFPGVTGLAVVVAAGVVRVLGRRSNVAPLVVAGVGAAIQLWALHRCLVGWWGGPGVGLMDQRRALTAWSGWPGEVVALACLGLTITVVGLVVAIVADSGRPVGSADP